MATVDIFPLLSPYISFFPPTDHVKISTPRPSHAGPTRLAATAAPRSIREASDENTPFDESALRVDLWRDLGGGCSEDDI